MISDIHLATRLHRTPSSWHNCCCHLQARCPTKQLRLKQKFKSLSFEFCALSGN